MTLALRRFLLGLFLELFLPSLLGGSMDASASAFRRL